MFAWECPENYSSSSKKLSHSVLVPLILIFPVVRFERLFLDYFMHNFCPF